jgi:hypothetical protein
MTNREFESKYKLLKQIAGGAGLSYTAQERLSGRAVLVHVFEAAAAEEAASLIERLAPPDRAKMLSVLAVEDNTVFVTLVLEGFQTFEGWLKGRAPSATDPVARPRQPPPQPRSPAQEAAGGGLTELFRRGERLEAEDPPAKSPPERSPASFTEMFEAPTQAPPTTPPASAQPPRTSVPSVPPVRVVELRVPQPRPQSREPAPPPLRPNFGAAPLPPVALPQPPSPRPPQAPIIAVPDPPLVAPAPTPAWSGPSEFTRQLERGAARAADVPSILAPPEPPDSAEARKSSPPYLLLVATHLIAMLVTGLVVYFVFGR